MLESSKFDCPILTKHNFILFGGDIYYLFFLRGGGIF